MPRARNIAGFFYGHGNLGSSLGGVNGLGRPLPVLVAVPTLPFFAAGIGRRRQGGQSGPAKGGGQRPSGRKRGEQN